MNFAAWACQNLSTFSLILGLINIMCCGLRLHVIIISVFGIMFSGFLHFTWNFRPYQSHLISNKDTKTANHSDSDVAVLLRCLKFLEYMNLFSNICSLIGAIRYKKYLLIHQRILSVGVVECLNHNILWTKGSLFC